MVRIRAVLLAIGLVVQMHCQVAFASEGQVSPGNFRLFDALLFSGKPELSGMGFERLELTGTSFWVGGRPADEPNEEYVRAYARSLSSRGVRLACLDIEHWPMYPQADDSTARGTIDKFLRIVRWMHEEAPEIQVGFYGLPPVRDYWSPTSGRSDALLNWNRYNDELMRLGSEVDVIFPSIYTFYDDPTGDAWRTYALANIEQARKYGKPVYVFLWPQYHDSNRALDGKLVPGSFWRLQLDTVYERADGVVIWGGWKLAWNPSADWWQSTLDFLRDRGFVPPTTPSSPRLER